MSATVRIVKTPDVLHGKPRVEGTRIGVYQIGELVCQQDWSIDEVTEQFALDRSQTEAAVDYYEDHPELMETLRAQRVARRRTIEDQSRAEWRVRLLCDQHVARKYRQAFEQEHWVTCTTVREMLAPDARDVDIAGFAAANDWVVFTNDDDFYGPNVPHGLVIYSQIEDPPPSDVVLAIAAINDAYVDATEIEEYVPDGWV